MMYMYVKCKLYVYTTKKNRYYWHIFSMQCCGSHSVFIREGGIHIRYILSSGALSRAVFRISVILILNRILGSVS